MISGGLKSGGGSTTDTDGPETFWSHHHHQRHRLHHKFRGIIAIKLPSSPLPDWFSLSIESSLASSAESVFFLTFLFCKTGWSCWGWGWWWSWVSLFFLAFLLLILQVDYVELVMMMVVIQKWNLSKNLHRRIFRLKIFNSFSKKNTNKWVNMEKFTPLAKILHCRRHWRHGQIPPLLWSWWGSPFLLGFFVTRLHKRLTSNRSAMKTGQNQPATEHFKLFWK